MEDLAIQDLSLDDLYRRMKQYPEADMPLKHFFTPHLYIRQIFMPAGTLVLSRIHKYEHPFVISLGKVTVWMSDGSKKFFEAPHTGITKPATQRVLFMHTPVIWTTFHVTDLTDPDEIVKEVTQEPDEGSITISKEAMKTLREGGA